MNDWSLVKTKTNEKVLITPLISLKAEEVNELGAHILVDRSSLRTGI